MFVVLMLYLNTYYYRIKFKKWIIIALIKLAANLQIKGIWGGGRDFAVS